VPVPGNITAWPNRNRYIRCLVLYPHPRIDRSPKTAKRFPTDFDALRGLKSGIYDTDISGM
jgi:hypothetical protein